MKTHCPHCQQRVEISDEFAMQIVACPSCTRSFRIPPTPNPSIPARTPQTKQARRTIVTTRKANPGSRNLVLALGALLVAAVAFGLLRPNKPAVVQAPAPPATPAAAVETPPEVETPAPPAEQRMTAAEAEALTREIEETTRIAHENAAREAAEKARLAAEKLAAEEAYRKQAEVRAQAERAAHTTQEKTQPPAAGSDEAIATEGLAASNNTRGGFVHPGLLHNDEDFKRMKSKKAFRPWKGSWEKMVNGRHADLDWKPRPTAVVVRGGSGENYGDFYRDIATAYVCAVCWRVTGKRTYAEKSIEILNAWSSTLKELGGNYDKFLAAGIYGYEIANAAEIMRTYEGWKPEDFKRFQKMMLTIFLPMNKHFVETHGDSPGKIDHFWPNWELCNLASMISIGVLCDDRKTYNEAVRYMKRGEGPGAIKVAVYFVHPDGLGQWTEVARDQGHTMMGIGLMATICEIAWKQGDDLYGYDNNRFLAACEYVAKYNLGEEVPFKKYVNSVQGTFTTPGEGSRGNMRPVWELPYNHYVNRMGLPAPWTTKMAEKGRPEGGVGDYGPSSGGYDQLGFGTFTATLEKGSARQGRR